MKNRKHNEDRRTLKVDVELLNYTTRLYLLSSLNPARVTFLF